MGLGSRSTTLHQSRKVASLAWGRTALSPDLSLAGFYLIPEWFTSCRKRLEEIPPGIEAELLLAADIHLCDSFIPIQSQRANGILILCLETANRAGWIGTSSTRADRGAACWNTRFQRRYILHLGWSRQSPWRRRAGGCQLCTWVARRTGLPASGHALQPFCSLSWTDSS